MNPFVEMIGALRGGIPPKCDWCGKPVKQEDMVPVSGGEWVCPPCLNIFDTELRKKKNG
jgi:formylmethanofuran dehydrogenase subunit E